MKLKAHFVGFLHAPGPYVVTRRLPIRQRLRTAAGMAQSFLSAFIVQAKAPKESQ